jgi:divalent metal cation (Fe/Co/Zn/Cd) transporter
LHILLPAEMQLGEAHRICEILENCIREELNLEPTIHIEPLAPSTS